MAHTALFSQGLVELKAGRFAEAKKLFAENEDKVGSTAQTKELLQKAEQNLTTGKVDIAGPLFNTVLERNPTLPEVYVGLARIAIFTGQLAEARTHAMAARPSPCDEELYLCRLYH